MDTSSVIALDYVNLVASLSLLFSRVLLPTAVRTELYRRRSTKDRLQAILRSYSFIEHCYNFDKGAVDVLLVERLAQGVEDRGEAEAVVQASETGAVVIVDDPWGRQLAKQYGREFHGTVWILCRFFELGLASGQLTRDRFVELHRRGIHLPWKSVNEFLEEIGERPIERTE
jgi:predicted nucleic acid-binding protein